MISIKLI